ncbi:MAG: thioredoxin-disulfide reductase [Candidatus Puniceispirillum sp.]|nr:thioredoxin-disulfide reductase [Candidatus Pelagibacter sp.]MBA4283108.1 thioredoxin-disulfide reductase [Candidatus Puniceispirillum sp.]
MENQKHRKVVIIGAGPAGYTAAIYAARANLKPLQFLGFQPGGQLMITTDVENFPGFEHAVQGPDLMEQMRLQSLHVGTEHVEEIVESVDLSKRPFVVKSETGEAITADTLIIATGAKARWLGLPVEEKFRGFGVSACATCDGFFYKNKRVAVVGGGNAAVEEAMYLTNFAEHVTLIHRRDSLRAEKIAQDRLFKNPKISVIWNSQVVDMKGSENPLSLTHLVLENMQGEKTELAVDGLFVAIGHDPASHLFKGQLNLDSEGYIIAKPGSTLTSVEGVFAAGDVQDKVFRQAVTAAGQGCMAALEAERYLSHR